jgi:hypothetical protein
VTCGLRISDSPPSANLTPQKTTIEAAAEVAADRSSLSCPGSSMVADSESRAARFENAAAPETIGPDLVSLVPSQSLTEESEVGEEPVKPDRTR